MLENQNVLHITYLVKICIGLDYIFYVYNVDFLFIIFTDSM
jgi:hypothetical protein